MSAHSSWPSAQPKVPSSLPTLRNLQRKKRNKGSQETTSTTVRPLMEGVEIPKPSGKIVPLMDLRLAPVVKPGEEKEDSSEDEDKKKHFRPKKQIRNVFTRMQDAEYGPLSILYRSVEEKLKVKVWTRSYRHVRGICTGYIVAFDKHWNLAMADVDEIYRKPFPRRTAWTMNIQQDQGLESNGETEITEMPKKEVGPEDKPFTESEHEYDQESQPDTEMEQQGSASRPQDDDDDISAELQTLSLLKEKLAQLDKEESARDQKEKVEIGGRYSEDAYEQKSSRDRSLQSGGRDRDRSPHRSHREMCDRSRSRDRSPKYRSRHERRESPYSSRDGSSRRYRKGESGSSSRDHTPSGRLRHRDSPCSSRDSSPSRRRVNSRRRSRSRNRSGTPKGDREKSGNSRDRERLASKSSSSKTKGPVDLREKLRRKKDSRSTREISPASDLDMHSSPSKNTRSRTKIRYPFHERDKDIETKSKSKQDVRDSDRKSERKTVSHRTEREGSENKSNEPTFLTVGSKTIIKRHVNQLFIRGDNVVMVSIVD